MSETTTGKTVRFKLDPANPPEMSFEQKARLDALQDEDIDTSDIPETAGKLGWRPGLWGAEVVDVRRAALRDGLLLLDDDVVELFKKSGDASPQKMNAVLREYVERQRESA